MLARPSRTLLLFDHLNHVHPSPHTTRKHTKKDEDSECSRFQQEKVAYNVQPRLEDTVIVIINLRGLIIEEEATSTR